MRWDEMRWDEMRWDEMRWDEIRWFNELFAVKDLDNWITDYNKYTLKLITIKIFKGKKVFDSFSFTKLAVIQTAKLLT
jgi:hypothetical protein